MFATVTLLFVSDGVRKFRHLFLFNDYIICTKRKITARYVSLLCMIVFLSLYLCCTFGVSSVHVKVVVLDRLLFELARKRFDPKTLP